MSIKMIGLDLDCTTLNDDRKISDYTKEILEESGKQGIKVVFSTGRSFYSMPDDVYDVKGVEYVVTSNGANIRELASKKTIYTNCIDSQAAEEVVSILKNMDYVVEIFTDGKAYTTFVEFERVRKYERSYRSREYVLNTRTPVDDIYVFALEHSGCIENINIFFEGEEAKKSILEVLNQVEGITVTSSMHNNIEIGGATTSKATGLQYLMKTFGIEKEELMCVGDSLNDIAMLKLAGTSVAVSNAMPEVKQIAKYETDTNDNEGVAKAIIKYALKEKLEKR